MVSCFFGFHSTLPSAAPFLPRMATVALLLAGSLAAAADHATFQLHAAALRPDGAPIPPRFVGLSIEVSAAPQVFLTGGLGGPPRPSFTALMRALAAAGGGAGGASVRVGGNSADESAWVPTGALPPNTTYRITAADLASYNAAVPLFNGSVILDTTLRYADSSALAAAHAAAAAAALGPLLEHVEIGNEPDLFYKNGFRPKTFSYSDYKSEYGAAAAAVVAAVPGRRLQGATWCTNNWSANFADYMAAFGKFMSSVSLHRYAGTACNGGKATIAELMADKAAAGEAANVAPAVATAAAHGVPLYIGEGNSVSCGGTTGVSDVWAAAVWAVDVLFNMAAVGVSRWNFHGMPKGPYATAVWNDVSADSVEVRPLFYGMLVFTAAASGGAVLQTVTTVASSNPFIKCWAVRTAAGEWRAVVLHKDPAAASGANATITIAPPARLAGDATLLRALPGPAGLSSKATDPISWRGLSYATTSDGNPAGTPTSERVAANGAGQFVFELPPASMAVLTLPQN